MMTKNADDDHDRLVDPLVANYLAKQFACAPTNRLKYPLLQSHIIIISYFFIIIVIFIVVTAISAPTFHFHFPLMELNALESVEELIAKQTRQSERAKMQQGEGANKVCIIL